MSITKDFEKRLLRQPPFYREKDVEELLAHTRALEAMLKKHEWNAGKDDQHPDDCCPECKAFKYVPGGHKQDCQLAKLLEGVD